MRTEPPGDRRGRRPVWAAIRGAPSEPLECWLGLFALLWGLWLLNPLTSTFASSPGFRAMAAVGTETSWGLIIVGVGSMELVGLLRHNFGARLLGTWSAGLLWTFLASGFGVANPAGTGMVAYGMIGLLAFYAGLLLGRPHWT